MRSFSNFLSDITKKPPIIFPLVGLFLVVWWVVTLWYCLSMGFPTVYLVQLAWMTGFAVSWIAACDARRWGITAYMLLMLTDVSIYLFELRGSLHEGYRSNLFVIDIIFGFVLLLYFKKLKKTA